MAFAIILAVENSFPTTYEEMMFWILAFTSGEYDAVIQSWLAKVQWDLVRPTTVVQSRGNKKIETWVPFQGTQEINSRDFQPYIRVMPHRFPSFFFFFFFV